MDDQAAAEIEPNLRPGEKLLWAGRPAPVVYVFYNGGGMGFISIIPIVGVATAWHDWRVALLIPAIVLFWIAGYHRGKSARYALTDQRALTTRTWPWKSLRSVPLDMFNVCIRQNFNPKLASIMYRKTPDPLNFWRGTPFRADAFLGLSDAAKVEKLVEGFSHRRSVKVQPDWRYPGPLMDTICDRHFAKVLKYTPYYGDAHVGHRLRARIA